MENRFKKLIFGPVRNQKGMALLMALTAILLMTFIAMEVSYDTNVEYIVASQQVNRLKAYYAARAGVEISLLRVLIYKKAMASFGSQLGANKSMLDPIWAFPFSWPPMLPDEMGSVDKDMINSVIEESSMDTQYLATIQAEGGRIDINDLASPIESLRKSTRAQLLKLFDGQLQNNEQFGNDMAGFNFEELLNNITDWIDEDQESLNGGGENGAYPDLKSDFIPPNQPFKTVQELHMVAGMTDDLYRLLESRITVFGTKGININYANKDVLLGLDPTMTEEAADKIIARRNTPAEGGPFQNQEDFLGFAEGLGVDSDAIVKTGLPLLFESEFNFLIKATGQFANVVREIEVVTYDFENLTERYIGMMDKQEKEKAAGDGGDDGTGPKPGSGATGADGKPADDGKTETQIKMPKGRPTIVYWKEN